MRKIIKNATIISIEETNVKYLSVNLLIDNNIIKKITKNNIEGDFLDNNVEIIDAKDYLIIPGMTNAHYHSYSNLLKGTKNNLPLEMWSLYTTAYGNSLEDVDVYNAVLLGAVEMIKSGVTACVDHFPHIYKSESALKAYEKSKMRVGFAPMMHDYKDHYFLPVDLPSDLRDELEQSSPPEAEEYELFFRDLYEKWNHKDRIKILLGPNAPQRCTKEMLSLCNKLSHQKDALIHTHLLETGIQRKVSDEKFENGSIGRLVNNHLFNEKLSVAHSIWLSDEEIELLNESQVSVIHNPASNMMLGSGVAPISKYIKANIPIALGTDGSNCGIPHNIFEIMRLTAMLNRISTTDFDEWIDSVDIFKMATIGGAHVLGEDSKRGKIAEGYVADLVFLNKFTETLTMEENFVDQLVFHETGRSVESVMIDGEWVMKDCKILTFDEEEIYRSIKERHQMIIDKSAHKVEQANKLASYYKAMVENFAK